MPFCFCVLAYFQVLLLLVSGRVVFPEHFTLKLPRFVTWVDCSAWLIKAKIGEGEGKGTPRKKGADFRRVSFWEQHHCFWSDYSDRKHDLGPQKVANWNGFPIYSRFRKYHDLARLFGSLPGKVFLLLFWIGLQKLIEHLHAKDFLKFIYVGVICGCFVFRGPIFFGEFQFPQKKRKNLSLEC